MNWRTLRGKPKKHIPSGIILVWLGADTKLHTKSIPFKKWSIGWHQVEIDAKAELILLQLDYISEEDGIKIKSRPMITGGLTRQQAKEALLKELQLNNKTLGFSLLQLPLPRETSQILNNTGGNIK